MDKSHLHKIFSNAKNLFIPYIERGAQILSHEGVQSLIVPEG